MRRYAYLMTFMAVTLLALFAVAELAGVPILTDPEPWLDDSRAVVAGVGLGLLLIDVLLPVPASLVMIAFGAAFGAVGGALLALIGGVAATLLGFWIGRSGSRLLDPIVTPADRARFDATFDRWGEILVVVSRPVPIIAETVAVMAGTTSLSWRRMAVAAVLGTFPAAALYAASGSATAQLDNGVLIFIGVMAIASLMWVIGMLLRRSRPAVAADSSAGEV